MQRKLIASFIANVPTIGIPQVEHVTVGICRRSPQRVRKGLFTLPIVG